MAGSKKKILIVNIPLNGARSVDTGAVSNTPRVLMLDEETNSLRIEAENDEDESLIAGSGMSELGTIDYTDINALPADQSVNIDFANALPKNSIPEYLVCVIEEPFAMGGGSLVTFKMQSLIQPTVDNSVALAGFGVLWENFQQAAGTKFANKYNVETIVAAAIALPIQTTFNFENNLGEPTNNPKSLSAGRMKLYAYYRNFTF